MVRSFDHYYCPSPLPGFGPPSIHLKFAVIFKFSVRTLDWNTPSSHTCHGHFSFVDFLVLFIILCQFLVCISSLCVFKASLCLSSLLVLHCLWVFLQQSPVWIWFSAACWTTCFTLTKVPFLFFKFWASYLHFRSTFFTKHVTSNSESWSSPNTPNFTGVQQFT